jgi:23S rRNA (pseudouridine1915-N3)-methyltransferase
MNVDLIAVDKLREPYVQAGCALYLKRLARYLTIAIHEVKPKTGGLEAQAGVILDRVAAGSVIWVLDREGKELDSPSLAAKLSDLERSGKRRLTLIIGGPGGLAPAVVKRADFRWSLSPLTFLHEMARLIVLEQLYRAVKINRNEPYHR